MATERAKPRRRRLIIAALLIANELRAAVMVAAVLHIKGESLWQLIS